MACGRKNDALSDLMECCICAEKYSDPRVLPCIHTFCLKCLEKVGVGKQPGDIMACPLCRGEFRIPDNGFRGIQKNFFMEKLIDSHGISTGSSCVTLCDARHKGDLKGKVSMAVMICFECNQKLCGNCVKLHKNSKALKRHQLADLKDKDKMNQLLTMKLTKSFCVNHQNEPINLFCLDCSSVICSICQFTNHAGHNCSCVENLGEKLRLKLKSHIQLISECSELSKEELVSKLDEQERSLLNCTDTIEMDVLKRAGQMIEKIDQDAKTLLEEICSIKTQKQKEIQSTKKELNRLVAMLESYKRYAIKMKERGSATDICRTYQDMIVRAEELQRKHRDINCYCDADATSSHSISKMVAFYPTDDTQYLTAPENVIGKINYEPWQLPDRESRTHDDKNVLLSNLTTEPAEVDPIGVSGFEICLDEPEISTQTLFLKYSRNQTPDFDILSNMSGSSPSFEEGIRSQCQVTEMNKSQNISLPKMSKANMAKELNANQQRITTPTLFQKHNRNQTHGVDILSNMSGCSQDSSVLEENRIRLQHQLTEVNKSQNIPLTKTSKIKKVKKKKLEANEVKVHSEADPSVVLSFRTLLMDKCQLEFEKVTDASEDAGNDSVGEQRIHPIAHKRFLGNIRFVGELFNLGLISMKIMQQCVTKLLTFGNDENSVKCFCELLTSIGRNIDNIHSKEFMDGCFDQLEKIASDETTSKCLRKAIQRVIDLRNNDWPQPHREENNSDMIKQVNPKVKQEGNEERAVSGGLPPRQEESNSEKIEQVNPKMEEERNAKREIIRNVEVLQQQLGTFKKELGNFLFRNEHTA